MHCLASQYTRARTLRGDNACCMHCRANSLGNKGVFAIPCHVLDACAARAWCIHACVAGRCGARTLNRSNPRKCQRVDSGRNAVYVSPNQQGQAQRVFEAQRNSTKGVGQHACGSKAAGCASTSPMSLHALSCWHDRAAFRRGFFVSAVVDARHQAFLQAGRMHARAARLQRSVSARVARRRSHAGPTPAAMLCAGPFAMQVH